MALGMSIAQVRGLPYDEYHSWQLFYLLEPWGFPDREYRTGAMLAKLHNTNVSKRSQAKNESDFIRDMAKEVVRAIERQKREQELSNKYANATPAERRRMLKQAWGAMTKDVKLGNRSDNSSKINP